MHACNQLKTQYHKHAYIVGLERIRSVVEESIVVCELTGYVIMKSSFPILKSQANHVRNAYLTLRIHNVKR